MTINENDFELISAYIDNELPVNERLEIESKINSSGELKEKAEEYKKLKLLTSKVKSIPDSPYFETRLYEKIKERKNPYSGIIRKYYPAFGIAFLTLALMIVFKFNTKEIDNIISKQKYNIMDLYAKNLKPILFKADVTKEDIFNFAFFNKLPIDKENHQYLALGTEQNGNGYFEIKNASFFPETNNLEKFMKSLKLNTHERKQVDSILESYIEDLRPQILVNDKNTIAISSNLITMNKAIAADLLNFAQSVNKTALNQIIPAAYKFSQAPAINQMIRRVKNNNDSDTYIFITPDTIFSESFRFNMDEFNREMLNMQRELMQNLPKIADNINSLPMLKDHNPKISKDVIIKLNKDLAKLKKLNKKGLTNKDFSIFFDSNYCKIQIPRIDIPDFELPDFDSIASQIENATKQFRNFSFHLDDGFVDFPGDAKAFKDKFRQDSSRIFKFKKHQYSLPNSDSALRMLDSLNKNNLGGLSFFGDSLGKVFQNMFLDSMSSYNPKNFKEQMRTMREEMKKFQKEMERMREDYQNNKPTIKEKKKKTPVEINSKRYYYNRIAPIIV